MSAPRSPPRPKDPPTCCIQKTLTVAPSVNAKTRQKHDYPSKAHRLSYGRRSAAERSNATVKDPASNDIARGWCRLMGTDLDDVDIHVPLRRAQPSAYSPPSRPTGSKSSGVRRWDSHQSSAGGGAGQS